MTVLIHCPQRGAEALVKELRALDEELPIAGATEAYKGDEVELVIAWGGSAMRFDRLPRLKAVLSLGAGVDHLVNDPTIAEDVHILRVVDRGLSMQIAQYCLAAVLRHHRRLDEYAANQRSKTWKPVQIATAAEIQVGVMGLGEMGLATCQLTAAAGYSVRGWSRSRKLLEHVETFAGEDQLGAFVAPLDYLVVLLPLTAETLGLLSEPLFAMTKRGVHLINASRGGLVRELDLLDALDSGQVGGATLDVFSTEPLPGNHPFWSRGNVSVTPHIAATTSMKALAAQALEAIRDIRCGRPAKHAIDRDRGY